MRPVLLGLGIFAIAAVPLSAPIGYTERGKHVSQFASTMPAHLILVCHAAALDASLGKPRDDNEMNQERHAEKRDSMDAEGETLVRQGHCSQSAIAAVEEATLRAAKPLSKSFLI